MNILNKSNDFHTFSICQNFILVQVCVCQYICVRVCAFVRAMWLNPYRGEKLCINRSTIVDLSCSVRRRGNSGSGVLVVLVREQRSFSVVVATGKDG